MRRSDRRALLWSGLLLVAGGCAGGPAAAPSSGHGAALAFPGAGRLLVGFDPYDAHAEWRAGDAVLFGLELRRATERRRWLLHVSLLEPLALAEDDGGDERLLPPITWRLPVDAVPRTFHSRCARVAVTVADADGVVLGRSRPLIPRDLLERGFTSACRLFGARHAGQNVSAAAASGPFADGAIAAVALLQVVQQDAVLAPLLWEVVERPSLWSLAKNLGARLQLESRFHAAEPAVVRVPIGAAPAFRVPMTLSANGTPLLEFDLVVAPVGAPLSLAGGVLAAIARHPHRSDTSLSLQLLAARGGPHWSLASGRDIALDRR